MTNFNTTVVKVPPTPRGLIPEYWMIEHWCRTCHQRVAPEIPLAHAQEHAANGSRDSLEKGDMID